MTTKPANTNGREELSDPIHVYPLPPQLLTNPYLDQLYNNMQSSAVHIHRLRPRQAIRQLLLARGKRVFHLHFFDELTQHPSKWQTIIRSLSFLGLLILLRLRDVHIVWTAHNIQPHELRHPFWAFLTYRLVIRWSTAIIAHGHAAKAMLEARYGAIPHCTIIPQGNYIDLYGPRRNQYESRNRLGLTQDQPLLLNFGALRRYKNIEMLIDAFEKLPVAERGTLLIIGATKDDRYTRELHERARTVKNVIVQNQFIPDAELPHYLAAADAIVLPYRTMLTSAILLWTLSYARPVIAPAFGPVAELIHEGQEGFLFAPGDVDSLQAALTRMLAHSDLAEMGETALEAARQFAWPQIAAQTIELYQHVANQP